MSIGTYPLTSCNTCHILHTMATTYTIKQFNDLYPDDNACLDYVFKQRFGNCKVCKKCGVTDPKYYRVNNRKVYECQDCGYQISPLANTIFHKSSTSLRDWFYVIYLFSVAKNGVSAKEVERHLGCTYKTAWRMCKQIRLLMEQQGDGTLGSGNKPVEIDETYMKPTDKDAWGMERHQVVFGIVERDGRAHIKHVPNNRAKTLFPEIAAQIAPLALINSDTYSGYRTLARRGYSHTTVNHSKLEFVRGTTHTNTIEGLWSQIKRSIGGTYHSVSPKYLQQYLNQFAFHYSYKDVPTFPILLERVVGRR